MAANMWKLTDQWGRKYYYEEEKTFLKRLKKICVDTHFEKERHLQHSGCLPTWWHEPKGWRIINDAWCEHQVDKDELTEAISKIQAKIMIGRKW